MSDISLNNVTSGYNLSKINANFQMLEDAHNDVAAWISGGNNTWQQDIDLNGNDLLNANSINAKTLMIDGNAVVPGDLGSFAPGSVGTIQIIDGAVTDSKIVSVSSSKVDFQQSGSGSIVRNVQNKQREIFSAKDFGCVADGVTDDSANLLVALQQAHLQGKTLFLPEGTYLIKSSIQLPSGYAPSVRGADRDSTIIKADSSLVIGTTDLFDYYDADGWTFENLTLDYNNLIQPLVVSSFGCRNCSNFQIKNCKFINIDKAGIAINGGRQFYVMDNTISRNTSTGTYNQAILVSSSSRTCIEGYIERNICSGSGMDLSCTRCLVRDNIIHDWAFGGGITTEQEPSNSNYYTISGNYIFNSTGTDVNATTPPGIENWGSYAHIEGNHIFNCSGSGIDQGGTYSTVSNNIIFNCGNTGSGASGITAREGAGFSGSFSTYTGNICFDSRLPGSKTQRYGYEDQTANVSRNFIGNNFFQDNKLGPIFVQGSGQSVQTPVIWSSQPFTLGTIPAGNSITQTFTVAGAAVGDLVNISSTTSLGGVTLTAYVTGTNTVTALYANVNGAPRTIGASTIIMQVIKPINWAAY